MKKLIYTLIILSIAGISSGQWVQMSSGIGNSTMVNTISSTGVYILAGTSGLGVYFSTNNGQNWTQTNLNNKSVACFAIGGSSIYAGTNNPLSPSGIWTSNNNGQNWSQTTFNNRNVNAIALNGNYIFAGINDYGIWASTNNGSNWFQTAMENKTILALVIIGNNIFAGAKHSAVGMKGVYLSTNNGQNWTLAGLSSYDIYCLAASGNTVFAGTGSNGVFYTNNNGQNWTQTAMNDKSVNTIAISGSNIFAGTFSEGAYLSTNNGNNWIPKNQGFISPFLSVFTLHIANNYIFTGTDERPVYRRLLSEIISIQNISSEIPSSYFLSQNYPNPFNPRTNIKFQVKIAGVVKLVVLDILGKEITALVNEKLQPGTYETTFDASAYPSGAYFYRIETGTFTDVKRMILIK